VARKHNRGLLSAPAAWNKYWNTGPGTHPCPLRRKPILVATIIGTCAAISRSFVSFDYRANVAAFLEAIVPWAIRSGQST
jgi:hypothetical protein